MVNVGSVLPFLSRSTLSPADIALAVILLVPLVCLWLGAIVDIILRRDLGILAKAAWTLTVVVLPWIGTIIYLIPRSRPLPGADDAAGTGSSLPRRLGAARSLRRPKPRAYRPGREPSQRTRP